MIKGGGLVIHLLTQPQDNIFTSNTEEGTLNLDTKHINFPITKSRQSYCGGELLVNVVVAVGEVVGCKVASIHEENSNGVVEDALL